MTGLSRMVEIRFRRPLLARATPPRVNASPKHCGRTLAAARRKSESEGNKWGTPPKAKRLKAKALKTGPAQNKTNSDFF
jgi:hypothetical protein